MKTIIHLETSDEERLSIAASLGLTQMVSRKQVTQLVIDHLKDLASGVTSDEPSGAGPTEHVVSAARAAENFTPSRGDEPYLYRPQDSELAAKCSAVLDGLEYIENYAWNTLERNRQ